MDALDTKIVTNANGLDFRRLAILAKRKGVTFEKILERAESGITDEALLCRPTLLPATDDWITPDDCRRILCVSIGTWAGEIAKHPTAIYWGIRAKSRSPNKELGPRGQGARGCGLLFYRPDIEKLKKIRQECHISFKCALRVFLAMSEHKI